MATLSFKKLSTLIQKHAYIISSVWLSKAGIQLLEVRSPKLQKTFLVHVSQKYNLVYDMDTYKTIKISPTSLAPSQKQIDYINEIKGSILVCDLASVSSKFICIHKNNGECLHYLIGEEEDVLDRADEGDEVSDLILKATKVIESHGETVALPSSDEDIAEVKLNDKATIVEPEEEVEEEVELEFVEDEEGSESESDDEVVERHIDAKATKTSLSYRKDNSIPPNIGDLDIMRGIVYYCISLSDFYKRMGDEPFERDVITIYDVLNDNDKAIRDDRVSHISELVESLVAKTKSATEAYEKREAEIKDVILSLSFILDKAEKLRSKGGDVEKIYTQTRAAIYDANIDLLKAKESIDDFLESIERTIEGYIEERPL